MNTLFTKCGPKIFSFLFKYSKFSIGKTVFNGAKVTQDKKRVLVQVKIQIVQQLVLGSMVLLTNSGSRRT